MQAHVWSEERKKALVQAELASNVSLALLLAPRNSGISLTGSVARSQEDMRNFIANHRADQEQAEWVVL